MNFLHTAQEERHFAKEGVQAVTSSEKQKKSKDAHVLTTNNIYKQGKGFAKPHCSKLYVSLI